MFGALLSLIPPSIVKETGYLLLLIGLSGEVAVVVVRISKRTLEKGLAVTFGLLVLAGVGLEYIADRPRALDMSAQQRIADALKGFSGTPFDFSVELDPESVSLMESIASALVSAGWNRQGFGSGFGFTNPGKPVAGIVVFSGLEIQITQSRRSQWGMEGQAATVLWHALQKERLTTTAKFVPNDQESPDAIHIKIGLKP